MKKLDEIKETLVPLKKELKEKYSVKSIGVFGSYARGQQKKTSDVDILVEFDESCRIKPFRFHRIGKLS